MLSFVNLTKRIESGAIKGEDGGLDMEGNLTKRIESTDLIDRDGNSRGL